MPPHTVRVLCRHCRISRRSLIRPDVLIVMPLLAVYKRVFGVLYESLVATPYDSIPRAARDVGLSYALIRSFNSD